LLNRPDLKFDDFVKVFPTDSHERDETILTEGNQSNILVLKKQEYSPDCIFLTTDNLCSIHEFKPLGCRIWPFSVNLRTNEIKWNDYFRDFIDRYCKHTLEDGATNEAELRKTINSVMTELNFYKEKVTEWNKKSLHSENEIEKFLIAQKPLEIYESFLETLRQDSIIKMILKDPFQACHEESTNHSYFLEAVMEDNDYDKFTDSFNILRLKEKTGADFIYFNKFPKLYYRIYLQGVYLYLYVTKISDLKFIYEKSELIYSVEDLKLETKDYNTLRKIETESLEQIFFNQINKISDYLNAKDFEKSSDSLKDLIYTCIFSMLYWINQSSFSIYSITSLKYAPEDFLLFAEDFEKYEKTEADQKKLFFRTLSVFESLLKLKLSAF
jgi:Fe-S-cluster containining protein